MHLPIKITIAVAAPLIAALATALTAPTPASAGPGIDFDLGVGFAAPPSTGVPGGYAADNLNYHRRLPIEHVLEKLKRRQYTDFRNITLRKGRYRIRCTKYGHRYKVIVDAYTGGIVRVRPI